MAKGNADNKEEVVAVAIDRDKGSQYALKWTIDHLLARGQTLTLVHVNQRLPSIPKPMANHDHHHHQHHHHHHHDHHHHHHVDDDVSRAYQQQLQSQAKELFLPYRCFCTRKNIKCFEVVLEDMDIAKALIDYVSANTVEILVLGAASRGGLVRRFKNMDVPSSVSKGTPNFCTVYVIAKGKISSIRSATCPLPAKVSSVDHTQNHGNHISDQVGASPMHNHHHRGERTAHPPQSPYGDQIMSPFTRHNRDSMNKPYEPYMPDTDLSFVSSGRPSVDRLFPSFYENLESGSTTPRLSTSSDYDFGNFGSSLSGNKQLDMLHSQFDHYSSSSSESGKLSSSSSSQNIDDVEAEMKRLKLELKQTMDMYSSACRAALTAKQKARELHLWKVEEEHRLEEARLAEEAALAVAEKEKSRCKAALEAAEAATRLAEQEAQKRMSAEMKALKETEGKQKALIALTHNDIRYRKYSIQEIEAATDYFSEYRKIGEGGYGPVYGCELDHTPVAIKVLRPDAAQGQSQFQQEVEVLSTIRHPNMVLLLGACPEYGCLVYEYMANGSLEDRLFCRGNTPYLPWQLRFRIAAEIGTGLLFLHHSKPEPLVHRDLKPANILLDRNYVSKISDVGLARLVPPSVADTVTQYRMTSTAGTFCYIDPEYQQTGMLGIKSDVYSLGVMLLQIITAKPPMGLTHHVERAIEDGTFDEMLDPAVPDWPLEEALKFAKLALQCTEMRRKDRPDLEVVLTELNRLRALAEDNMYAGLIMSGSAANSPRQRHTSTLQDMIRDSELLQCRHETPKSRLSTYHFS